MADNKQGRLQQFVTFRVDNDLFGLDIRIVKEVNPTTDITVVPLAPEKIRGLVNIRGQIVLVVDIAVLFDRPQRPLTAQSQLVIIKTRHELELVRDAGDLDTGTTWGEKPIAFLVDGIGDVLPVGTAAIERVPPHIPERIGGYLHGVVRAGDELLILLDAGRLLGEGTGNNVAAQPGPTGRVE